MKKRKINNSTLSTIIGALVAIANAWLTIEWEHFELKKEWPKLALSGIIALGGFLTQVKTNVTKQDEEV